MKVAMTLDEYTMKTISSEAKLILQGIKNLPPISLIQLCETLILLIKGI